MIYFLGQIFRKTRVLSTRTRYFFLAMRLEVSGYLDVNKLISYWRSRVDSMGGGVHIRVLAHFQTFLGNLAVYK